MEVDKGSLNTLLLVVRSSCIFSPCRYVRLNGQKEFPGSWLVGRLNSWLVRWLGSVFVNWLAGWLLGSRHHTVAP